MMAASALVAQRKGESIRSVAETLETAPAWVAWVRGYLDRASPRGSVYSGPAAVVRRWLREHADAFGVYDLILFPVEGPDASRAALLLARRLERGRGDTPGEPDEVT